MRAYSIVLICVLIGGCVNPSGPSQLLSEAGCWEAAPGRTVALAEGARRFTFRDDGAMLVCPRD